MYIVYHFSHLILSPILEVGYNPSNQQRPLIGGIVLYQGQSRWQSFVHPSLMPVLEAKAFSCLGHMKIIYFKNCTNMFVTIP